jgi:hypothetical protein
VPDRAKTGLVILRSLRRPKDLHVLQGGKEEVQILRCAHQDDKLIVTYGKLTLVGDELI